MTKLARTVEERKTGTALSPWRPWGAPGLMDEIEQLFGGLWRPWWPGLPRLAELPEVPPLDVFEEGDVLVVKAELPGLTKEEIEIALEGDVLTISGKKEKEEKLERKDYHRYERSSGAFSRVVTLPVEVEADKATAHLEKGVLELRLPRKADAHPRARKIAVA